MLDDPDNKMVEEPVEESVELQDIEQDIELGAVEPQTSLWHKSLGPHYVKMLSNHYGEMLNDLESLGWRFELVEEGADKTLTATKGKVCHCCTRMFLSHCVGHLYTVIIHVEGDG